MHRKCLHAALSDPLDSFPRTKGKDRSKEQGKEDTDRTGLGREFGLSPSISMVEE